MEATQIGFEQRKNETLFGINPYTQNESSIYRALPSQDRCYFKAFSEADTPDKRKRILELVPRNQREVYLARWKLKQTQDLRKARDGMLNEMIQSNANKDVEQDQVLTSIERYNVKQDMRMDEHKKHIEDLKKDLDKDS